MIDFLAFHSKKYDNFNDDILEFRKRDDIVSYLEVALIEIAKVRPQNIKYLGYTVDNRPVKTNEIQQGKMNNSKVKKNELILHCKDTFAKLVVFKFELTVEQVRGNQVLTQKYIQELPVFIPVLIDDYHYRIRGNDYAAPIQVIDSLFYSNQGDVAILKTLARAITISRAVYNLKDIYGNEYKTYNYFVSILPKKRSPLILFYFGYFGFENTFKYFGADKLCKLVDLTPEDIGSLPNDKIYFKFGQHYLECDKEMFDKNIRFRQFIACVVSVQKRNMTIDTMRNVDKWLSILGDQLLEINSINKGKNMINTFINSLDYITKSVIAKTVDKGYAKQDMFSVIKWTMLDFNKITSKSTIDLSNKRLRLGEYIISIIVKYLYKKLYKFINKPPKSQDLKSVQDIFKINSQIIVSAIIGRSHSKELNLNILKYCDYVNDNAYLNAALSATHGGPSSPLENQKSKNLSVAHRRFNTSYVGNESIIDTSTTNAGVSIKLSPYIDFDIDSGAFLNTTLVKNNNIKEKRKKKEG